MDEQGIRLRERQVRWEVCGADRGIERYRQARDETSQFADTDPGQRILLDVMTPLVASIAETQEQVTVSMGSANGRWPTWWLPILCLEPEKMAYITLRSVVNRVANSDPSVTRIALAVTGAVRLQREFDMWHDKEFEKAKVVRDQGEKAVNLYKMMCSRSRKIDTRVAAKWMKKATDLDKIDWPIETRVHLGTKLIELGVLSGQGYFEIIMAGSGEGRRYKTERQVKMTALAEEFCASVDETSELNRPLLMPMLCQPADWREVPRDEQEGTHPRAS